MAKKLRNINGEEASYAMAGQWLAAGVCNDGWQSAYHSGI